MAADESGPGATGYAARVRARLLALIAVSLAASAASAVEPCEAPPGFPPGQRLTAADVVVVYRTVPASIEIGQHFSVEAIVCARPPATEMRMDAHMPEHRHGMNYRPRVAVQGNGRYLAEGFLFHMPGLWQLVFDVDRGGRTERLATDITLE